MAPRGVGRLLSAGAYFLLAALPASAGGPGTTAAVFLNLGLGPRTVGLGSSFVGLADDANAIAYNPAGLAALNRQEITLMHNQFLPGVHQEWFAYAYPRPGFGTIAVAANILLVEPFPGFDQNDQPIGATSAMDAAYHLAYARSISETLSLGVGAVHLRSRLDDRTATALAVDAGAHYRPRQEIGVGIAVLHAGTKMKFIEESFDLPLALKAGLSVQPLGDRLPGHELTLLTDVTVPKSRGAFVSGGVEFVRDNVLTLRAGGRSNREAGLGYSVGLGLAIFRHDESRVEMAFDYAFEDFGELSHVHRAGITLKFGRTVAAAAPPPTPKLPIRWYGPKPQKPREPESPRKRRKSRSPLSPSLNEVQDHEQ